ncbi:MAG TPA: NAD(P)-dependent alcohol dehydrogenase [Candidatus Cybelea sp.]|jgi:NADPH:quinone reductase-like Zn-dependent oxidoreductase|nr:NAD(P)-dependent alcohol dehydrogenase [Candidatus Cybelea sp.]
MKAAVYTGYGSPDVLQIRDVEKPVPKNDEVLIRVRAASVNAVDWRLMRGNPYVLRLMVGLRESKIGPGRDVAGEVEAGGASVTEFKPGDSVFGTCHGAFAEYACARESRMAKMPENVTFEQAACVPFAGSIALQGLRKGRIAAGCSVLINGASGGVGSCAVQIAKAFGAEVTGVCSTRNVELVRSLGADHVIDYMREDFTKAAQRYDGIFDCVTNHSLAECRRALRPDGICVVAGAPRSLSTTGFFVHLIKPLLYSRFVSQKFVIFTAKSDKQDLLSIRDLLESGKLTPAIDRRYGLSEIADAVGYVEEGHARGKVVVYPLCRGLPKSGSNGI